MDLCTFAFLIAAIVSGCPGTTATPDAPTGTDAPANDAAPTDAPSSEDTPTPGDAPAADAPVTADAPEPVDAPPTSGSCDARRVLCDALPPICSEGEAPSVVGACWGPCIPATSCTCSTPEECPDIRGYSETCYTGRGFCGPFL